MESIQRFLRQLPSATDAAQLVADEVEEVQPDHALRLGLPEEDHPGLVGDHQGEQGLVVVDQLRVQLEADEALSMEACTPTSTQLVHSFFL